MTKRVVALVCPCAKDQSSRGQKWLFGNHGVEVVAVVDPKKPECSQRMIPVYNTVLRAMCATRAKHILYGNQMISCLNEPEVMK